MKLCKECNNEIKKQDTRAIYCSTECQDRYTAKVKQQRKLTASIEKYKDKPTTSYIICQECGFCGKDLNSNIINIHNMTTEYYLTKHNITSTKCIDECERVKGDKNPAYQHGGKFSPFSDKFIYNDGSEEAKEKQKRVKKQALDNSINKDCNRINKKEFWLTRGYTEEEAKEFISLSQNKFSLDICIKKYGEVEGRKRWELRQQKWQETLNSKSDEEKADINRRKTSLSIPMLWSMEYKNVEGMFYILLLNDNNIKIGITTKSIKHRYGQELHHIKEILKVEKMSIQKAFVLEQVMKKELSSLIISKNECLLEDGYTEVFKINKDDIFKLYYSLTDKDKLYDKFKEYYPKYLKYDFTQI